MITDSWFAFAADALVRTHMKYDNQTIYYYVFGYVGSLSITKLFGESSDNFGKYVPTYTACQKNKYWNLTQL